MPQPGSHKYDIKRSRLRNKLDDSGIPDQRADELANAILQDPNPKKFRRLLQARVVRNAGRFLPRTGR
jgi:hypothetical protein